jgi:hypothetical protein
MSESQALQRAFESSESQAGDEFAARAPNRLNRLVVRLVEWTFHPPHFPSALTWTLLALIASDVASDLLPLPASYWIDPGTSPYHSFLSVPFSWGLWNLAFYLGYLLLVGVGLSLLNARLGFGLWLLLGMLHLWDIVSGFQCWAWRYFPFENSANCATIHSLALVLAALLWGLGLLAAARLGQVAWIAPQGESPESARGLRKGLRLGSLAWIVLMAAAVSAAALGPKPAWRRVQPAHIPPGRTDAALTYDSGRSVAVLFGGTTSWSETTGWKSVADTWEWDGADWTEMRPAQHPSPRYAAGLAYDPARQVSVLFGGMGADESNQPVFYADTWEWDGRDWSQIQPAHSPPPRQSPLTFFDPLRQAVVVYGGYYLDPETQVKTFYADAWAWDGHDWAQLAYDDLRRTSAAAIVFDASRQLPVLMDGEGFWVWQDLLWVQPNLSPVPPPRWGSRLAYDPASQQVVLFGGSLDKAVFDDTWTYDGQAWGQVVTTAQPPQRSGHNMFYDPTRGRVMLFGGLDVLTFYNDMWELVIP